MDTQITHPPFDVILADPPWPFRCWTPAGSGTNVAAREYPCLSLDQLCAFDVRAHVADTAFLALWTPASLLYDAPQVAAAWGFDEYATVTFVWAKRVKKDYDNRAKLAAELKINSCLPCIRTELDRLVENNWAFGTGSLTRQSCEFVLGFWRGKPHLPRRDLGVRQEIVRPRAAEHSRKPDDVHQRLETLFGPPDEVRYAELFARRPYPGWNVWGNEVASTFTVGVTDGWVLDEAGNPQPRLNLWGTL